jgi:hypothetical protein
MPTRLNECRRLEHRLEQELTELPVQLAIGGRSP